ncbi:type 1 glutamine amidotransferase [Rhodalgimonas zhirmunskyi]|uniref:Type 1 glutamine amidotransferase n=1 Tax=Rhodalgimonas zhirmunskyi TaxID=2964767 RepID=A0AAJ1U8F7_9RHOB|nr:type 1 glutamine amidotransferase [Rhodoalgimonas zhirmunskyi]MDQ2093213.1 type 1 glutamine amidotransferase [Rhodoalgimonas zhirmunskyi]
MKIGILITGHVHESLIGDFGEYDGMFERLLAGHGFTFESYAVVDGVFPENVHACDGWIITGSKHGAYEDHPWIPPLEAFIRDVARAHVPMIGICFGHQIIAQAMGGTVEKFSGGWAVGPQSYDIDGENMMLNAWHQDQVTQLPPDTQVIGANAFCSNAALLIGDSILTIQPHPEFNREFTQGLLTYRGPGSVPQDQLDKAQEALSTPTDSARFADRMARFFKEHSK